MTRSALIARPSRPIRFGPSLPIAAQIQLWIAAGAVVVVGLLSYGSVQASMFNAQRVTHALEVIEQLQTVLSTMKDAETGQRGFLLTGDASYLGPYTNAKETLAGAIQTRSDAFRRSSSYAPPR
jgi:CHASE3 domain sensor protein